MSQRGVFPLMTVIKLTLIKLFTVVKRIIGRLRSTQRLNIFRNTFRGYFLEFVYCCLSVFYRKVSISLFDFKIQCQICDSSLRAVLLYGVILIKAALKVPTISVLIFSNSESITETQSFPKSLCRVASKRANTNLILDS